MADSPIPPANEPAPPDGETSFGTWAEYAEAHPEAQPLHDAETAALKGALDKEREKAKTASAQLRELAKTADPDTAERLRKAADEKDAENKSLKTQLEFTSAAAGLGCRVIDKAWAYAQATGQTAEQMKADPDLASWFTQPVASPRTNAGNGTGQAGVGAVDMDSLMRARLGRG